MKKNHQKTGSDQKRKSEAREDKSRSSEEVSEGITFKSAIIILLIVAVCAFILGARGSEWLATSSSSQQNSGLPQDLDYSQLDKVYDKLRSNYAGKLNADELLDGAKEGMVEATGDPYSEYFTAAEAEEFFSSLSGEFTGIGAELGLRGEENQLTVVSTIKGTPAGRSDLKQGDIIVAVNDQPTQDWSLTKAVSKIRGKKGTTVKLMVLRSGNATKTIAITRDDIDVPSVESEIIEDNIGVIEITRFSDEDTVPLARQAAKNLKSQGVKGIILDLRGNGGGYVQAAEGVAGIWLSGGKVIVEEKADGKTIETIEAEGNQILVSMPTVVLIDGASASASEIVAGALSDYGKATLVGETSYGKGSVQQLVDIDGGAKLKVTVAKWFTPKGKNINDDGLTPEVKVKRTQKDIKANRDPQKAKAVEVLKN